MQIAGKINSIIVEMGLRELGQLEQDLVFGDAGGVEVINFLRTKQVIKPGLVNNKVDVFNTGKHEFLIKELIPLRTQLRKISSV